MLDEEAKQKLLWQEFQHHSQLYTFYLKLLVELNLFVFAIAGGILRDASWRLR